MTTAVILAGGLGTRLRSAVPDLPKPMAPIDDRPFLEYLMDYWIGEGVDAFVLSVGYRSDVITQHFGRSYRGCPIVYAIENEPLGTGGGLLMAAREMDAPFLVVNGDTFFEVRLSELSEFHVCRASRWTFALFRTDERARYMGMGVRSDGRVESMQTASGTPGRLANGGVYYVDPAVFADAGFGVEIKLSLEDDILPALLRRGEPIFGFECSGRFIDIGIPEDYRRAAKVLTHRGIRG